MWNILLQSALSITLRQSRLLRIVQKDVPNWRSANADCVSGPSLRFLVQSASWPCLLPTIRFSPIRNNTATIGQPTTQGGQDETRVGNRDRAAGDLRRSLPVLGFGVWPGRRMDCSI